MVDELRPGLWAVEVWGLPPYDHRRTYTIDAQSDNDAANEGIGRFVAEMENLPLNDNGVGW